MAFPLLVRWLILLTTPGIFAVAFAKESSNDHRRLLLEPFKFGRLNITIGPGASGKQLPPEPDPWWEIWQERREAVVLVMDDVEYLSSRRHIRVVATSPHLSSLPADGTGAGSSSSHLEATKSRWRISDEVSIPIENRTCPELSPSKLLPNSPLESRPLGGFYNEKDPVLKTLHSCEVIRAETVAQATAGVANNTDKATDHEEDDVDDPSEGSKWQNAGNPAKTCAPRPDLEVYVWMPGRAFYTHGAASLMVWVHDYFARLLHTVVISEDWGNQVEEEQKQGAGGAATSVGGMESGSSENQRRFDRRSDTPARNNRMLIVLHHSLEYSANKAKKTKGQRHHPSVGGGRRALLEGAFGAGVFTLGTKYSFTGEEVVRSPTIPKATNGAGGAKKAPAGGGRGRSKGRRLLANSPSSESSPGNSSSSPSEAERDQKWGLKAAESLKERGASSNKIGKSGQNSTGADRDGQSGGSGTVGGKSGGTSEQQQQQRETTEVKQSLLVPADKCMRVKRIVIGAGAPLHEQPLAARRRTVALLREAGLVAAGLIPDTASPDNDRRRRDEAERGADGNSKAEGATAVHLLSKAFHVYQRNHAIATHHRMYHHHRLHPRHHHHESGYVNSIMDDPVSANPPTESSGGGSRNPAPAEKSSQQPPRSQSPSAKEASAAAAARHQERLKNAAAPAHQWSVQHHHHEHSLWEKQVKQLQEAVGWMSGGLGGGSSSSSSSNSSKEGHKNEETRQEEAHWWSAKQHDHLQSVWEQQVEHLQEQVEWVGTNSNGGSVASTALSNDDDAATLRLHRQRRALLASTEVSSPSSPSSSSSSSSSLASSEQLASFHSTVKGSGGFEEARRDHFMVKRFQELRFALAHQDIHWTTCCSVTNPPSAAASKLAGLSLNKKRVGGILPLEGGSKAVTLASSAFEAEAIATSLDLVASQVEEVAREAADRAAEAEEELDFGRLSLEGGDDLARIGGGTAAATLEQMKRTLAARIKEVSEATAAAAKARTDAHLANKRATKARNMADSADSVERRVVGDRSTTKKALVEAIRKVNQASVVVAAASPNLIYCLWAKEGAVTVDFSPEGPHDNYVGWRLCGWANNGSFVKVSVPKPPSPLRSRLAAATAKASAPGAAGQRGAEAASPHLATSPSANATYKPYAEILSSSAFAATAQQESANGKILADRTAACVSALLLAAQNPTRTALLSSAASTACAVLPKGEDPESLCPSNFSYGRRHDPKHGDICSTRSAKEDSTSLASSTALSSLSALAPSATEGQTFSDWRARGGSGGEVRSGLSEYELAVDEAAKAAVRLAGGNLKDAGTMRRARTKVRAKRRREKLHKVQSDSSDPSMNEAAINKAAREAVRAAGGDVQDPATMRLARTQMREKLRREEEKKASSSDPLSDEAVNKAAKAAVKLAGGDITDPIVMQVARMEVRKKVRRQQDTQKRIASQIASFSAFSSSLALTPHHKKASAAASKAASAGDSDGGTSSGAVGLLRQGGQVFEGEEWRGYVCPLGCAFVAKGAEPFCIENSTAAASSVGAVEQHRNRLRGTDDGGAERSEDASLSHPCRALSKLRERAKVDPVGRIVAAALWDPSSSDHEMEREGSSSSSIDDYDSLEPVWHNGAGKDLLTLEAPRAADWDKKRKAYKMVDRQTALKQGCLTNLAKSRKRSAMWCPQGARVQADPNAEA